MLFRSDVSSMFMVGRCVDDRSLSDYSPTLTSVSSVTGSPTGGRSLEFLRCVRAYTHTHTHTRAERQSSLDTRCSQSTISLPPSLNSGHHNKAAVRTGAVLLQRTGAGTGEGRTCVQVLEADAKALTRGSVACWSSAARGVEACSETRDTAGSP